jgi:drug/metabolite transporter (DMT)-like permease
LESESIGKVRDMSVAKHEAVVPVVRQPDAAPPATAVYSVLKVVLAGCAVILCWAYSPVGIRVGLEAYSPGHVALLRFLMASAFMAVIAMVFKISLPRLRDVPMFLVLGFFAVTLHHLAINTGQHWVSAGASSVLSQSSPLFSTVIARVFLKEQVSGWRWLSVLVGLTGAFIVVSGGMALADLNVRGFLILVAALSWSIYFTLQKRFATRYSLLTMVCCTVWAGTLLLCVYLPGLGDAFEQAPLHVNVSVLLLGIFPSALAYLAWAYVLNHTELSRASVFLYLVPPMAILMAAILLGERVCAGVLIGGAIVISSVVMINLEAKARLLFRF